mgnify:CR=1 FL=1
MAKRHPEAHSIPALSLQKGPNNLITDVAGVTVGHCTLDTELYKTGVTVIMPCPNNPFHHKLPAGVFVLNGFGKTLGLMQLAELGVLETPIALTSTLNVGLVHDALVGYMVERCALEGTEVVSVNPIVCECCDGKLSRIQDRPVREEHVRAAIAAAGAEFAQGDAGAGKGTICHGLKGGIGSASRVMEIDGRRYTLGMLVHTNHGILRDLTVGGRPIGAQLAERLDAGQCDKGSVIAVFATDLPLDGRQLRRVAARVSVGLARLGSYIGQGSGELFLGFSTANPYDPRTEGAIRAGELFSDDRLDLPFRAAAACAEEAVLHSMLYARSVTGYRGDRVEALGSLWQPEWAAEGIRSPFGTV